MITTIMKRVGHPLVCPVGRDHCAKWLTALAFALASAQAAGCLVGSDEQQPDEVSPRKALGKLTLVDADYPIPGDGEFVLCAEYEYDGRDGLTYTIPEKYNFSKLRTILTENRAAQNAAGEHGIDAIDTCDDARKFSRVWQEHIESMPSTAGDGPVGAAGTRPPMEASAEEDLIDKVKDSAPYAHPTVAIRSWKTGGNSAVFCSGFFIKSRIVVTAAHCIPYIGNNVLTVEAFSPSGCVYPSGSAGCDTYPGPASNAWGTRHPDWPGSVSATHDIGIYELYYSVDSPMDSSSNWMRFASSNAWDGLNVWLIGWGANSYTGSGVGTERISDNDPGIDWVGSNHFFWTIVSGEGRSCDGDSGGPTIATAEAAYNVVMGDVSNSDTDEGKHCGYTGGKNRHTMMSANVSFIEGITGSCSNYSGYDPGFTYRRCW